MNIYERRRKALQNLLDYWEQSIGMMKAVEYTATNPLFVAAVRWRAAISKAIAVNEIAYQRWKRKEVEQGNPPWRR